MANLFLIKNIVASPHHIAVVPGDEYHAIDDLFTLVSHLKDMEINRSYDKSEWRSKADKFAEAFTKLSQKSGDNVNNRERSVSFANLHSFLVDTVAKLPAKIADNSHQEVHIMSSSVQEVKEEQ